ncbi:MAG TPA: F0F1 ATP synthase subunit gamma [Thermomicrobiaceae bacterium]|nr:F0F1 ATP synthase subunit gamma [Thermomicrobiaceae bacterium]
MPTPREIRRRIRSVRNMAQVTRAMEMVAASKMRRAQQQVLATRPYAERIRAMTGDLATMTAFEDRNQFPLLIQRPIQRSEVILVTSDRGLAGALNTNVIRRTVHFMQEERAESPGDIDIVAVGRKGRDFFTRLGRRPSASFVNIGDRPTLDSIRPIVQIAIDDFTSGKVDAVFLGYTQFINTLRQVPQVVQILPITAPPGAGEVTDYIFEPSPAAVLEALLPRFVEVEIYQAVLEAIASEQSARMVAMRNATDNAREIVSDLTMTYNKVRQAQITREVSEISAGAAALG